MGVDREFMSVDKRCEVQKKGEQFELKLWIQPSKIFEDDELCWASCSQVATSETYLFNSIEQLVSVACGLQLNEIECIDNDMCYCIDINNYYDGDELIDYYNGTEE